MKQFNIYHCRKIVILELENNEFPFCIEKCFHEESCEVYVMKTCLDFSIFSILQEH